GHYDQCGRHADIQSLCPHFLRRSGELRSRGLQFMGKLFNHSPGVEVPYARLSWRDWLTPRWLLHNWNPARPQLAVLERKLQIRAAAFTNSSIHADGADALGCAL